MVMSSNDNMIETLKEKIEIIHKDIGDIKEDVKKIYSKIEESENNEAYKKITLHCQICNQDFEKTSLAVTLGTVDHNLLKAADDEMVRLYNTEHYVIFCCDRCFHIKATQIGALKSRENSIIVEQYHAIRRYLNIENN